MFNTGSIILDSEKTTALAFDRGGGQLSLLIDRVQTLTVTATALNAAVPIQGQAGVTAADDYQIAILDMHTGGAPVARGTDGTNTTPSATSIYFAEVFVPVTVTLSGVSILNGSAASGNVRVGLADGTGAVVASSAATAMAGTNDYQPVRFTADYEAVGPATYYVLLAVDNATARIRTHAVGNFGAGSKTGQSFAAGFTPITPPTTFQSSSGPIATLISSEAQGEVLLAGGGSLRLAGGGVLLMSSRYS